MNEKRKEKYILLLQISYHLPKPKHNIYVMVLQLCACTNTTQLYNVTEEEEVDEKTDRRVIKKWKQ